jgi:hypothetical protein
MNISKKQRKKLKSMKKKEEYKQQILGEVFTPVFMTEDEFEKGYKESIFWTDKDFMSEYRKHIAAMSHVSECAKIYILKNWTKVKDWSELDVVIVHGPSGKMTEYYNYVPREINNDHKIKEGAYSNLLKEIDEENKLKHNPIREFNEVILDPTDGDFSVTVNGNEEHWWIQDEAVIIIADYIEQQLKKQNNEEA